MEQMEKPEMNGEMKSVQDETVTSELSLQTLSEDCVFEVFDRLPTNYLYTIAGTCARLHDLAAIQYRRKHPQKYACLSMIDDKIVVQPDEYDVQMFGRKFINLMIRSDGRNCRLDNGLLEFIVLNCSPNLQIVRFEEVMLQRVQMESMKQMLHRIETLVLHKCGMTDDFYDCLLRHCHSVRHLIISDSYTMIETAGNKWLLMTYPQLECVQLCSITMVSFSQKQWEIFFRQNPKINSFSCDHWYSINSLDRPIKIISRNARNLKRLYISLRGIGHLNATYYDLSVLCRNKQFQWLELQFSGDTGIQYMIRHCDILSQMDQFHALHLTDLITKEATNAIASFVHLKQVNFVNTTFDTEFAETVSKKLTNLEEICCDIATNDFTPFIRNSPKLSKIELPKAAIGELNLGWGLLWLNDERNKIPDACPITIYVRSITTDNAEVEAFSSGTITIQKLVQDKRNLLKVNNTFVN